MGGHAPIRWGHGPLMWALFSENVCKNERIGSHGGGMHWACPPRSANDRVTVLKQSKSLKMLKWYTI